MGGYNGGVKHPLIWDLSLVTLLVTPLVTTHEPRSTPLRYIIIIIIIFMMMISFIIIITIIIIKGLLGSLTP